jgi:uncharacterized protein (DUF488 family)
METVFFSEMLASTNESVWCQNPEHHHHPHHRENLRSYEVCKVCFAVAQISSHFGNVSFNLAVKCNVTYELAFLVCVQTVI